MTAKKKNADFTLFAYLGLSMPLTVTFVNTPKNQQKTTTKIQDKIITAFISTEINQTKVCKISLHNHKFLISKSFQRLQSTLFVFFLSSLY